MTSFVQFFPTPSSLPQPLIRDAKGNPIGGEVLEKFNAEVEDLSRVIHAACYFTTPAASAAAMPKSYDLALVTVLARHGFTKAFTADEVARNNERAAQEKRNAALHAEAQKKAEAFRESENIDRLTRRELGDWLPTTGTLTGSPSYARQRAAAVEAINIRRKAHNLSPLSV